MLLNGRIITRGEGLDVLEFRNLFFETFGLSILARQ